MSEEEYLSLADMAGPPENAAFVKHFTVGYEDPCWGYVCDKNGYAVTVFRKADGGCVYSRMCIHCGRSHKIPKDLVIQ